MVRASDGSVSTRDVLQTLLRHRRKMLLVFSVVMAVTVAWIVFASRAYESVAKLYIRMGRENVTLDPTASTGETVRPYQTHENAINSTLHILESRQVVEQVVEAMGPASILAGKNVADKQPGETRFSPGLLRQLASALDAESERSRAIHKLESTTSIWSPSNSSVVIIRVRAGDPIYAQTVVKAWTKAFLSEHLRLTRTQGAYPFFARQVKSLAKQLADAEGTLRQAKDAAGLASIDGQQRVLEDQMSGIRAQLAANQAALESAKAKVSQLQKEVDSLSRNIVMEEATGVSHNAWDRMREKLYELQILEGELKAKYTAVNPRVITVENQRKRLEAVLAAQPESRSASKSGPNPTRQVLHQALLSEQANVSALTAARGSLNTQFEQAQEELRTLNQQAIRIGELKRQVAILDANYRNDMRKMEQARIHEALEHEGVSSINVLQTASFTEKPVSPDKTMTLLIGLVVAVLGSVGVAFGAEYFDRSFSTAGQVEDSLGLPVLASIPRISSRISSRITSGSVGLN